MKKVFIVLNCLLLISSFTFMPLVNAGKASEVTFFFENESLKTDTIEILNKAEKTKSENESLPDTLDLKEDKANEKFGDENESVIDNDKSPQEKIETERRKPAARQADDKQEFVANEIRDISIKVNDIEYFYFRDSLTYDDEPHLFFEVEDNQAIAEVRVFPEQKGDHISGLKLLPSGDFDIIDSMVFVNNEHYRTKVRFHNLFRSEYSSLVFNYLVSETNDVNREFKMLPYFLPKLEYDEFAVELFRGEEKTIEITGWNLFNVKQYPDWQSSNSIDYRLTGSGNVLKLDVRANTTGQQILPLKIETNYPILNNEREVSFDYTTIELKFNVKPSRLQFLNTDKDVVFFEADRRQTEEIQLDYHPSFQLRKNYRIEDRQEAGGTLIAELYPKSITSDNKMLADIRTYDLHRVSDGYLYVKDDTRTLFMTNFSILNRPEISKIEILREGGDWTSSLSVYPGEKIEVKVEGNGLLDANIKFDGCIQRKDSVRMGDNVLFYEVTVPIEIPRRKIIVFLNQNITQHEMRVREYQRPAEMNFVKINYGRRDYEINSNHFRQPVFYDNTIRDINIIFDPDKIDAPNNLNGKQYLTIEIRILDDNNKLLDLQTINNIVVCPGEKSPRHAFYGEDDCRQQTISINDHMVRKTYNLDAFSQVIITVKHNENQYGAASQTHKATIFVERKIGFDIMVSFPAGLLVKEFSQSGIGNLSGISTSVLAEISFYDPNRIGSKKPYKFGAGFIALNAFNFSESENIKRDIGIVAIAVVEPVRGTAKFSVPIYFGIGYLLKESDFFAIFGPGIRLHF